MTSDDRARSVDEFAVSKPAAMTLEFTSGQESFTMAGTLPPGS
jgi:hypothetical protein